MKPDTFERIVNFLLGASGAFVLFGAFLTFETLIVFGLSTAIFSTFIYIFFGLFIMVALDAFVVNKKRLYEAKKQTKLLEEIASKLDKTDKD